MVGGRDDQTTIDVFPYTFPTLANTYDCGNQAVTVDSSQAIVNVTEYDPEIDGFHVIVKSYDRTGSLERRFYVYLTEYPEADFYSAPFTV